MLHNLATGLLFFDLFHTFLSLNEFFHPYYFLSRPSPHVLSLIFLILLIQFILFSLLLCIQHLPLLYITTAQTECKQNKTAHFTTHQLVIGTALQYFCTLSPKLPNTVLYQIPHPCLPFHLPVPLLLTANICLADAFSVQPLTQTS